MEVQKGRAGRAQRRTGRESLDAASDEQPRGGIGEHEQNRGRNQRSECAEQDRPPAHIV